MPFLKSSLIYKNVRSIAMYEFFLNLWLLNRVTPEQIDIAVAKGRLTAEEGEAIKATPR